jgi:D-aminoacyl-tRNA deacylase
MDVMYLVVTSAEDVASMNIRQHILSIRDWAESGKEFDGSPVLTFGNFTMVLIKEIHLHFEELDVRLKQDTDIEPDCVIFASRHKSESKLRTLTVHPLGNYGDALYGGTPGKLVPTAPKPMTSALLALKRNASALDFEVSFECTHHGPFLRTPTFFIEIGSDETAWPEKPVGEVLAKTILDLDSVKETEKDVVAIGVGGGHYAPRHSEVVLTKQISMGHMVPNYALDNLDEDMARQVIDRTPGCEVVYFHRKSMKKPRYRELKELFEDLGLRSVSSVDLVERL